jgi:hypothetical protein
MARGSLGTNHPEKQPRTKDDDEDEDSETAPTRCPRLWRGKQDALLS